MCDSKTELFIPEKQKRIPAIDRFRGLAMSLLLMFGAAIMFENYDFFKPFTTHDLSVAFQILPGYGFYDLGAPLFLFASGLSFGFAFSSAERKFGTIRAYGVMAERAVKIVGMGALLLFDLSDPFGIVCFALLFIEIIMAFIALCLKKDSLLKPVLKKLLGIILMVAGIALLIVAVTENILLLLNVPWTGAHWGALPSIGCAILLAIPFTKLKPQIKVLTVLLLTTFYFSFGLVVPVERFTYFEHGGLLGAIGYGLCFVYADLIISLSAIKTKRPYIRNTFAALMACLSVISFEAVLPSKACVNTTYILISFTISYFVYCVISLFDGVNVKKFRVLSIIGQNCMMVYVINFFATYVYGICVDALVGYVEVGNDAFHVLLYLVGMSWYPMIMAWGIAGLNKRGIKLKF